MTIIFAYTQRGIMVAEAASADAAQALGSIMREAIEGTANLANQSQDVKSIYDQMSAWINNNFNDKAAQDALKTISSSAFGTATTMLFVEYDVGEALLGGAAAIAGLALSPALLTTVVVVGGVAVGYAAGEYYNWAFDELCRRGKIIGAPLYDFLHPDWIKALSSALGTTPDPLVKTVYYYWRRRDPLILDLDGDGLEITPMSKDILFDANGDAIKTATAWVGADDGLLAWDRNGNGSIDSGAELFGDQTLLANGQKKNGDGARICGTAMSWSNVTGERTCPVEHA